MQTARVGTAPAGRPADCAPFVSGSSCSTSRETARPALWCLHSISRSWRPSPLFSSVLRAPFAVEGPLIIVVCLIGACTISGTMSDVYIALAFGVQGYVFKKLDYPIAPLILAMVLGDKTENAFRQSMLLSDGAMGVFFANGLVATITTAALLLAWGLVGRLFARRELPAAG